MSTEHAHEHVGHIVPLKVLAGVWAALLVLTVVTVAAARIDLGEFNIWLALAIATVKASLVAMYFMHLRYDNPFNGFLIMVALVFVMLFVSLSLMDTMENQPSINAYDIAYPESSGPGS